jgi:branched-chain amino acid aminotransferase
MQVWQNNGLVEITKTNISADGWPDGEGVFETIRTQGGEVFELGRHMRRALVGVTAKGFKLPDEEVIRIAIDSLLTAEPHRIGRLRLLFSKDQFVAVHQSYEDITKPIHLTVLVDSNDVGSITLKTFPYEHRLEILEKAHASGFDEMICKNDRGEITEGAVSSFLFRIDGQWITTPLSSGVLAGVQRGIAIERCGVSVRQVLESDLEKVEAAFVISSLKIALSVSSIAGRALLIDENCTALAQNIWANTDKHSVG